jgi:hypothetical protein
MKLAERRLQMINEAWKEISREGGRVMAARLARCAPPAPAAAGHL